MTNPTPEQRLLSIMGGQLQAMNVCINALMSSVPTSELANLLKNFDELAEHTKAVSIPTPVPDLLLATLEEDLQKMRAVVVAGLE